jgi:hypothetical protein
MTGREPTLAPGRKSQFDDDDVDVGDVCAVAGCETPSLAEGPYCHQHALLKAAVEIIDRKPPLPTDDAALSLLRAFPLTEGRRRTVEGLIAERDAFRAALTRIADMPTTPRNDGTYNYDRNALVQIASMALGRGK